MTPLTDRFHPSPQSVELTGGVFELPPELTIQLGSESTQLHSSATRLQAVLEQMGSKASIKTGDASGFATIELLADAGSFNADQAYRLEIDRRGVRIVGSDIAGTVYGVVTLIQCLTGDRHRDQEAPTAIECLRIGDWPEFVVRGVLLDISRDRVPKMRTLLELIDLLASWKINQIQLYMEHTFAYEGHEIVWKDADPLTAEDIRTIDRYCHDHCIELVPNQNSFGHFHRWLIHEAYRPLAECPEGVKHPFNEEPEPFSLCAIDPKVLDLLGDLYDQLLPNFTSTLFNVGLDETFDLGIGRSAAACQKKGKGHVYLEYLKRVNRLVEARGHRMQFWADILLQTPEVVGELPESVIPLEWGYEADHPFEKHGEILASTGLDFYVCPGTSSWNSLSGRTTNAIGNLSRAAIAGKTAGAGGYLITDWGDFGHLQPLTVSLPGFLIGAGCAWNTSMASDPDSLRTAAPALIDRFVFDSADSGLGELILSLGDTYRQTGAEIKNGSVLFFLLVFATEPLTHPRFDKLDKAGLEAARDHIEKLQSELIGFGSREPHLELPRREMEWVAGMLLVACKLGIERLEIGRDRSATDLSTSIRAEIRSELAPLVEEYRWLWSQRSRPGGLSSSSARLERILALLG